MAQKSKKVENRPSDFDQLAFDEDLEQFFDMAFEKLEQGKLNIDQVGGFFPTPMLVRVNTEYLKSTVLPASHS